MTPSIFFSKALFESTGIYDSDADEEDQFLTIDDDDDDEEGYIRDVTSSMSSADSRRVDDASDDGTTPDYMTDSPAPAPEKTKVKRTKSKKAKTDEQPKEKAKTAAEIRASQWEFEQKQLYYQVIDVATRVAEGYSDKMPPEVIDEFNQAAANSNAPEEVIAAMEKLGIKANSMGVSLDDSVGSLITPDMVSRMYYLSMPNRDDMLKSAGIVQQDSINNMAAKLSNNIAGKSATPVFKKKACGLFQLMGGYRAMNSGSQDNGGRSHYEGKQVTYLEHPNRSGSCCFAPTVTFEAVLAGLREMPAFANIGKLEDVAAELLYMGQEAFKERYGESPEIVLPKYSTKNPYVREPTYGTIDGSVIKCTAGMANALLTYEIEPCCSGILGAILDKNGNEIPNLGDTLRDTIQAKLGKSSGKSTISIPSKKLADAVMNEYMFQLSPRSAPKPLFTYFAAEICETSQVGRTSTGDDEVDIIATYDGKQDVWDERGSGDVKLANIDNALKEQLSSGRNKAMFTMLGLKMPDMKLSDYENMRRMTRFLMTVSDKYADMGVKSRITTRDGVRPIVEIDPSENTTMSNCPIAGIWRAATNGTTDRRFTEAFGNGSVYSLTAAFLKWIDSHSSVVPTRVADIYNGLFKFEFFADAKTALMPNICVGDLIDGIAESKVSDVNPDTLTFVRNYVIKNSSNLGVPFLSEPVVLRRLLEFIKPKVGYVDIDAGIPSDVNGIYDWYLAKLLYWTVEPNPNTGEPAKLVKVGKGGGARTTLLDYGSAEILRWISMIITYSRKANTVVPLAMGLLRYALDMQEGSDEELDEVMHSKVSADIGAAYDEPSLPLPSLIAQYDSRTRGQALMAILGDATGDNGVAIGDIMRVASLRQPAEEGMDNIPSEEQLSEDIDKLSEVAGVSFPGLGR